MEPTGQIGRLLLIVGLAIAAIGALLLLAPKVPWLGRLPGDIVFEGRRVKVYLPLATSLLLSLLLTLLLYLWKR